MSDIEAPPKPSPWHEGERRMHLRLGVAESLDRLGRAVIRDFMPDQHRSFYGQLPFLIVGAVDETGAAWATLLEGTPGFITSPDRRLLRIGALPGEGDPVAAAFTAGSPLGLLGIDPSTRRRNRMNGAITARDDAGFSVAVEHAFGNCPQYIQTRSIAASSTRGLPTVERRAGLDDEARAAIAAADTFFVASYVDLGGSPDRRAVDVSHRGGRPGFVRIDGDLLTIPDFAGNLHFNTIGNLLLNPRAGLLFVDFESGDLLHLTGDCEVDLEGEELAAFQGAERLWRFTVRQQVRRRRAVSLRGSFGDYSPNTLLTGSWEEASARQRAEALRHTWRPFRVLRIVEESAVIRSFHLEPEDGAGTPHFEAGQFLPIRVRLTPDGAPQIRAYSISVAPSDRGLRISVKRDGAVSQHLHDRIAIGDRIEARAPDGSFTIDAAETRPAVLLSAGVGVTPMLAMLRHVVFEGLRTRHFRRTFFVHGSRTRAERPFDTELEALVRQGQGAITAVRVLSKPEPDAVSGADYDHRGRIDARLLKATLPPDDYDFYLCGPASFTQGLYTALRALRIPDDRIRAEAFGPSTLARIPDPGMAHALPALAPPSAEAVQVIFARSAVETQWTPGSGTLLDLAEARGLTPEFGCRTGTCGTCRTRVLEGEVTYASRPTATPGVGSGLICCAVPAAGTAPRVVLEL